MERKITIKESVLYKEDYQMRMLTENKIRGILPVSGRGMNGNSFYDYDVSGKISMKAMFERSKMSSNDIKKFLEQLKEVIMEVGNFLLSKDGILLDPEYIFYGNDRFYFCYYPLANTDFWEEFHVLTEYFVKQADYEEQECVNITFLLHKETMEENYSLDKLIETCLKEKEPEIPKVTYDTSEHEWIAGQAVGSSILRETDNLWSPVRKFLSKHKKSKWGEWDGLYVEEEEFS